MALAPLGHLSPAGFYRVWYALLEIALWSFCASLVAIARSGVSAPPPASETGVEIGPVTDPGPVPPVPEARLKIAQQLWTLAK